MTPSILTVVTPADSYDLTVLATVKAELGITGTSEDTNLARWIRGASSAIATYCRRVFAQETVRETFRLRRGHHWACEPVLPLKRYPIASITSVTEDGTALTTDQYEVEPESGLLYRLCDGLRREWTAATVVVVYTGGYVLLPELPDAIEQACISLVSHYRANAGRDMALRSESIPGVVDRAWWVNTTGADSSMPPDVPGLIDPFRNRIV